MAMSPGTKIRHNAAAFGIPLDLRGANPGELGMPVPVRATAQYGQGVVMASPTAASLYNGGCAYTVSKPSAPPAAAVTVRAAAPPFAAPPNFVTPFSAMRTGSRRAQGGA
jgi:hypothetical protein